MLSLGSVNRYLRSLVALLGLMLAGAVVAQEIRFSRLDMADGLSQSSVMAIAQCQDGFMWFGTQYGLDRFDGHEIRSFRHRADDPHTLSNSRINALKRAADGRLWVATAAGLDRFDTRTGRAERFAFAGAPESAAERTLTEIVAEHPDGRLFLSAGGMVRIWDPASGLVHRIPFEPAIAPQQLALRSEVLDRQGRYWAFNAAGLWQLDEAAGRMRLVMSLPQTPDFTMYSALALTADDRLALAADDVFKLIDPDSLEVLASLTLEDLGGVDERINGVMTSSDGLVWLPTPERLLNYQPADGSVTVLFAGSRLDPTENARQQLKLVEHPNGDLYFPSQYGLGVVRPSTGEVRVLAHDPTDLYSLPQSIPQIGITAHIDDEGNVWVGTHLGGVAWHSPLTARFGHIEDRTRPTVSGVPFAGQNVVRSLVETRQGEQVDLWLALDRAGVRRLRLGADGRFFWHQSFHQRAPLEHERLPEDTVWALAADPLSDHVWVLGSAYLVAMDGRSDRVLSRTPLSQFGLYSAAGQRLRFSRDGSRLWLGSTDGVLGFALESDRVGLVALNPAPVATGMETAELLELGDGRLLALGDAGVAMLPPDLAEPEWLLSPAQWPDLPRGPWHAAAEHPEGGWWLAGQETGLVHLRVEMAAEGGLRPRIERYGPAHGLIDSSIYALLPEQGGRLWLSSNNGLMRWDPRSGELRHFTPPDGVQALEFNQGAAYASERGYLYFGGINGVNHFRPERFAAAKPPPRLRLQEVRVNGQVLDLNDAGAPQLRLRHRENDLEIRFVGLQLSDPQRVRYAFRLEGVDGDWIDGDTQRQVRYASLQPGDYRFHLRAANSDGVWSEPEILLSAIVARPPWATPWALSVYGLLLLLAAGAVMHQSARRRRVLEEEVAHRTAALIEQRSLIQRQARELEQALESRTTLFANVSHEFRTPLTLIQTSLDRLERQGGDPEVVGLGRRYLTRLLRLVDQLMDVSSLSRQQEASEQKPWPLGRMIRMTVDAFSGVAQERGIELVAEVEFGWRTRCHQEQVEKILLNLLTNALKFTPPGGQVRVSLTAEDDGVNLSVADSGQGIPLDQQETIFERFYRVPAVEQANVSGAGIGLALVREAARANGGRVSVSSRPGHGSRFNVFLPAWRELEAAGPVSLLTERDYARDIEALKPLAPAEPALAEPMVSGQPSILVVEDNIDMRQHLTSLLRPAWRVIEAADGEAGLELALSEAPDLIVSDIMMPGLDGLSLLQALRGDMRTSHIPVLLLTARHDQDTRVRAYALQADGFLGKPFHDEEFLARLAAMVETRRRLHDRLRRELNGEVVLEAESTEREISERDRMLLERLRAWLEAHHADPDIKVNDMARAVMVDVRTLQRKLRSLLDQTPAGLLQDVRLDKARALLLGKERSIKDIAASCGFSSPQMFSKVFSQTEGLPPSQWRRRAQSRTQHH